MDVMSALSAIVIASASIVVAGAALWGLKSWRDELKGRAKFEVAKNVMLLGLRVRQLFVSARFPMTGGAESAERQRSDDESAEQSQIRDEWFARSRRANPLSESIDQLREVSWEAKVVLDADAASVVEDVFARLNHEFATVVSALNAYFEYQASHVGLDSSTDNAEWLRGLRKDFYGLENDELMQRVNGAVDALGPALQKYVR